MYTNVQCSRPSRIDNQSGYRVSLAFYTTHSETPNDSNPNGKTIDAMLIFIFLLLIFFLTVCNSSLSRTFGEFPNVVSRDNAYADRRKGVFYSKMLHLFSKQSHINFRFNMLSYHRDISCLKISLTAIVHSLVQRPVPNLSGIQGSNIQG